MAANAFIASTLSLDKGFQQIQSAALLQKIQLQGWVTLLAGNINAQDALNMFTTINQTLAQMSGPASLTGMQAYAQSQFGSPTYDIAAAYTQMVTALTAIKNWISTNVPANSLTITNGAVVPAVFAPASTAPLLTLVNAAIATIA